MATPFTDFVVDLVTDTAVLAEFQASRSQAVAAMSAAGLGTSQQELLLTLNVNLIQNEIANEALSGAGVPPNKQSVFHSTTITVYDT